MSESLSDCASWLSGLNELADDGMGFVADFTDLSDYDDYSNRESVDERGSRSFSRFSNEPNIDPFLLVGTDKVRLQEKTNTSNYTGSLGRHSSAVKLQRGRNIIAVGQSLRRPESSRSMRNYSGGDTRSETSGDGKVGTSTDGTNLSMSKNAILARENRQKKKEFIDGLAKSVRQLTTENNRLKGRCSLLEETVDGLQFEVEYLRGVIYNQSALAKLLKNIPVATVTSGEDESSSHLVAKRRRHADDDENDDEYERAPIDCENAANIDHDYGASKTTCHLSSKSKRFVASDPSRPVKRCRQSLDIRGSEKRAKESGVCLHVSNNVVTFELCAVCNRRAQSSVD